MYSQKRITQIRRRLAELSELPHGWLDGEGKPIPKAFMQWFTKIFLQKYVSYLPRPYIYPTENGDLLLEWGSLFLLEIDSRTRIGQYYSFKDEDVCDGEIDLSRDAGWIQLITLLRQMLPRCNEKAPFRAGNMSRGFQQKQRRKRCLPGLKVGVSGLKS